MQYREIVFAATFAALLATGLSLAGCKELQQVSDDAEDAGVRDGSGSTGSGGAKTGPGSGGAPGSATGSGGTAAAGAGGAHASSGGSGGTTTDAGQTSGSGGAASTGTGGLVASSGGAGGTKGSSSGGVSGGADASVDKPSADAAMPPSDASTPPADAAMPPADAAMPPADAAMSCAGGSHACLGSCVPNKDVAHCGSSCDPCVAPTGATATCDGTQCGFDCGTSKRCGTKCVPSSGCCADADCPTQNGMTGQCDSSSNTCKYMGCATGFKPCGTSCIAMANCCSANDCTGSCQTCSGAGGTCVAVKNQDDTDSCAGTCDGSGACKSKRGQTCTTVSGGCIGGSMCSPDGYCCDTACTGTCMACDLAGFQGTCTAVASGNPHGNRTACAGAGTTCGGTCAGRSDGTCSFPTGSCGSGPTCSGAMLVGQGACNAGSCAAGSSQTCANALVCSGTACKTSCSADGDCVSTHFCAGGSCRRKVTKVALGNDSSCVVVNDGKIWCWGANGTGQLGTGSSGSNLSKPTTAVMGLPSNDMPTSLSLGYGHACATVTSGGVYCWGNNDSSQLGDKTTTNSASAIKVGGLPSSAKSVAAGGFHTCALLSDNTVWCWGNDQSGQVGDGMLRTGSNPAPTKVLASNGSAVTASAISAGDGFSCALNNGNVLCWGDDSYGQIGKSPIPTTAPTGSGVPAMVNVGGSVSVLGTGEGAHACVITSTALVRCWGSDFLGELGDGVSLASAPYGRAAPVTATFSGTPAKIVSDYYSSCALTSANALWCWGTNANGQLGTGTADNSKVYAPVQAKAISGRTFVDLSVGKYHTCVLTDNGSVWCFGDNVSGQLGNNSFVQSPTPVQVVGW